MLLPVRAEADSLRGRGQRVDAAQGLVDGVRVVTSPMIEPRELPSGVAFVDRFRAAYKEEPFYAAAYAYDATHLIAAAIRHSERYDADTINKALRSIDALAPATQAVRFRPDGEQHYAAVGVYTVRSGRWEALIRTDAW
jgi:branched-chain amino acid transport system substrate-binding protein